ncbi:MAG TPA: TolC family protein [Polyangiaceae bacterium]|nr:TolC family protein [Polyangiaceae bacterium]
MSNVRRSALVALALACSPALALAQAVPTAPSTPSASPAPPTKPGPNAVPIDTRTAVRQALEHSPSLLATRLGVDQARQDVLAQEGNYPYVFQADAGHTRAYAPSDASRTTGSRSYTVGTALRRTFPFGTSAEVRLEGERAETDVAGSGLAGVDSAGGSGYATTARLSVTQPLLRNFGTRVGESGLRTARLTEVASQKAKRRAVSGLARDVLVAYWELWLADESVRINQTALELAKAQEQQAEGQRASGALAPADVYGFSTRVANVEDELVVALVTREQRSLDLNRLMGVEPNAIRDFFASEEPAPGTSPTERDVETALRSDSVELAEAEAQLKVARERAEVAGESSRPSLDVEAYVQTHGEDPEPFASARRAAEFDWLTVHVGAVYQLPLDASQRNAEKQSALIAVRIAEQNLKALRNSIATDAMQAVRVARAAEERLVLSARAVQIAEKSHEAARARFELGGGIALDVRTAEENLQRARLTLARTRVALVQTQIDMQHLTGRLVPDA